MKVSRKAILQESIPIILANSTVPLVGLADTTILGQTASVTELAAIAPGVLLFNFIYWGAGFLRMGTTGSIANLTGKGDKTEVRNTIGRSLFVALILASLLIVLQIPIIELSLSLLSAPAGVESYLRSYFLIRIYAAPATLSFYVITGAWIALSKNRLLLSMQLVLNATNILLNLLFAVHLEQGIDGIALGTVLSSWMTTLISLILLYRFCAKQKGSENFREPFFSRRLFQLKSLLSLLSVNGNLMIRTLFLLSGFALFTELSAGWGETTLAANQILLQFISFSAFFLDGFAFTAESRVGQAAGKKDPILFQKSIRYTAEMSAITSLFLSLFFFFAGEKLMRLMTDLSGVLSLASQNLVFAALYIFLSFPAFLLDGVFIGTLQVKEMRNASIVSFAGFFGATTVLVVFLDGGNPGLWAAFILFVVLRALTLAARYRSVIRNLFDEEYSSSQKKTI